MGIYESNVHNKERVVVVQICGHDVKRVLEKMEKENVIKRGQIIKIHQNDWFSMAFIVIAKNEPRS